MISGYQSNYSGEKQDLVYTYLSIEVSITRRKDRLGSWAVVEGRGKHAY